MQVKHKTQPKMTAIDIEKVLESKAPGLARKLPRFVIKYLKRIVHEDDLNHIISTYFHLPPYEFIKGALGYMGVSYHATGLDKIDPNGRYLFASNHPFGGMDGMMLAELISTYLGDVRFISNDILMVVEPLRPIMIPVNKHGRQSRESADAFNAAFNSDIPMLTFPAGLCSRRIKGKITDLEWKTNFVKKAIASERDIVPVHCEGKLSNFFYNLSNIRTRLGVKANLEMLYLVDEMFKQKGKDFNITFGAPISYKLLKDMPLREAVEYVRKESYALAGQ